MIKKIFYSFAGVVFILFLLIAIGSGGSQPTKQSENLAPVQIQTTDATSTATTTQQASYPKTNKPTNAGKAINSLSLYPDPALTPGDVFPVDTATVCTSGYTATVRSVPLSVKKQVYAEYGVSYPQASGAYEVDHFIPLEIGGSNDIKNLWLEPAAPTPGFHQKDQYENYAHAQVCSGAITLQEAQRRMATDWYKYWVAETGGVPISNSSVQATTTVTVSPVPISSSTTGPQVKKSATGICHEIGSTYYDRTTTFTPYNSLSDCLASGGRLPKQ